MKTFLTLLVLLYAAAPSAKAQTGQVVNGYGLCLQVNGPIASGSRLQSATCVPNAANQTFSRGASNELRMPGSLCVDAFGGGRQGAEVGLWTCTLGLNQIWAPSGGFLVTQNNFCMAVDGGNRNPGTRIITYSCINDPSQKWTGPTASGSPAPPPAAKADMNMITAGYAADFGRNPRQDELAYWSSIPASDARVSSRAAFLQNNRNYLKTNAAERDSVITLSYNAVFRRAPSDAERNYWRTYVTNNGSTYDELVAGHRDYLAKNPPPPTISDADRQRMLDQSYASAFGRAPSAQENAYWKSLPASDARIANLQSLLNNHRQTIKTDAGERYNMITRSYQAAFRRDPSAAERNYWDPQVRQNGTLYTEMISLHADFLSKNPPPAPAPTPVKPVAPAEKVEQCFGAVGKGCEGSGSSWYDGRSDLIPMLRLGCSPANGGWRNCWIAPGSIKHDNCCHSNPNGKACGGNDSSSACSNEWEMACNDIVHGRAWAQAVPDGASDLTPVASSRYPSGERRSTAALCAPGGANISVYHGAAFCCSGRFKETWVNPLLPVGNFTREWGVCADPGAGYSLQSTSGPKQWTGPMPGGPGAPPPPPTAADIQRSRR